jgi:hypothetical protein
MTLIKNAFKVLFTERRLPHRISIPLNHLLYKQPLNNLFAKASQLQPVETARNATTTIHMLTSANDLHMGIFALRSFLRYHSDVNLNIYGDGSLSANDASQIRHNFPRANVILHPEFNAKLSQNNRLNDLYHRLQTRFTLSKDFTFRAIPWSMKFIIPHLFQIGARQILLDSDTLFVAKPEEVLNWSQSSSLNAFYSRPFRPNLRVDQKALITLYGQTKVLPAFCAGFLGFPSVLFPIEYVLDTTSKAINSDLEIFSDECLWRYLFSGTSSIELPCSKYPMLCSMKNLKDLGLNSEIKYYHFHLKHEGGIYYKHGKKVLRELTAQAFQGQDLIPRA